MCMLCVIPPNVLPSREKLENSALNNPDGFGYAIAIPQENRILVHHTMNADEAVNKFLEDKAKYPKGYALWHARLATQGSNTLENCHPFYVGKDKKTVLAHNGVLPFADEGEKKSLLDRSDTRIFAEHVLPRMGGVAALDDPHMYEALLEITNGSKVAVLTVNPVAEYQLYLLHEKAGSYDADKVWWSNNSCELNYYKSYYTGGYSHGGYTSSYAWKDEYDAEEAEAAREVAILKEEAKRKAAKNKSYIFVPEGCSLEYNPREKDGKKDLEVVLKTPKGVHNMVVGANDKEIYTKITDWVTPLVKEWNIGSRYYDDSGNEMAECLVCDATYSWWEYMYCPNCSSCAMCEMSKEACMCYHAKEVKN